jgi:hypothetical protein
MRPAAILRDARKRALLRMRLRSWRAFSYGGAGAIEQFSLGGHDVSATAVSSLSTCVLGREGTWELPGF